MTPQLSPHATAIVAAINDGGLLARSGAVPDGAGWQGDPGKSPFEIYAVVWPLGPIFGGSLENPDEEVDALYQVSCWGNSVEAALHAFDLASAAIIGRQVTVPNRHTLRCRHD